MRGKKYCQQIVVGNLFRIELDADTLGMPRPSGADLLIAGIGYRSASISGHYRNDALEPLKHCLGAPKTSAGKDRDLHMRLHNGHNRRDPGLMSTAGDRCMR